MDQNKKVIPVFKQNLILRGKIECLTGMHIGGSKEKLQIGGLDSIVIRSPRTQYPYIPGSSLKGKLRHLLEYLTGGVNMPVHRKKPSGKEDPDAINLGQVSRMKEIVRLFGVGVDDRDTHLEEMKDVGLGRLIVRDAHPDRFTAEMWEDLGSDVNFTEFKAENGIDRLTSAANPRFVERVVEGSFFDFELVYTDYRLPDEDVDGTNKDETLAQADLDLLLAGLRMLENNYIGKNGSRGYGRIQFLMADPVWITVDDYKKGDASVWTSLRQGLPAADKLKKLNEFSIQLPQNK
jgi:CRISPR-associated protein Csm3